MEKERTAIGELSIDRRYIKSALAAEVFGIGGEVLCKPWVGAPFGRSALPRPPVRVARLASQTMNRSSTVSENWLHRRRDVRVYASA